MTGFQDLACFLYPIPRLSIPQTCLKEDMKDRSSQGALISFSQSLFTRFEITFSVFKQLEVIDLGWNPTLPAEQVYKLRSSLPNCKIKWTDPAGVKSAASGHQ